MTVGPRDTTVSAIAERAGVERLTVYRHFPDEKRLFAACTAHYMSLHPPPDPRSWSSVHDLGERLRRGLSEQYAWFAENERRQASILRDVEAVRARLVAGSPAFRGARGQGPFVRVAGPGRGEGTPALSDRTRALVLHVALAGA